MTSASTKCSACGYVFPEDGDRKPCPNCGSTTRNFYEEVEVQAEGFMGLDARHHRPEFSGFLARLITRFKRSLNGNVTREELTIDRSHPDKTIKSHRVDERQPDKSWKVIHEHIEEYEAKRRLK